MEVFTLIFVYDRNLIGDTISTLPTLKYLTFIDKVFVYFYPPVYSLLSTIFDLSELTILDKSLALPNYNYDLGASHFTKSVTDPISFDQQVISKVNPNLKADDFRFPLYIKQGSLFTSVDYIISPFTRSNEDNNKSYTISDWQKLFEAFSDKTFCVLGDELYDPKPWNLPNVEYKYNMSLQDILTQVRYSKYIITVDNGIGVLLKHLRILNHIYIWPTWIASSKNPYAITLEYTPTNIDVAISKLKELL
jgi:hypothetical protein